MDQAPSTQREELAIEIIRILWQRRFKAFLVGGCVRDRLLGVVPKDYDVSTDAGPSQLLELFPGAQTVGAHFGVVLVRRDNDIQVEVSTFRSEGIYTDGRRPDEVYFESDPALDAQRRDFTINGLFEDPITRQVYDYVGGKADLQAGVIRAIGNPEQRFAEDHLRMLRAVRFAARLRFQIEDNTLRAIRKLAPQICRISAERIREELTRILTEGGARYGFELLDETGLLSCLLPEVKAFQGVQQPPQYHPEGDVWTHVLMMLEQLRQPSRTLAWAVLLHDVGKPPTFRVADRIRFDGHAEVGAIMAKKRLSQLKASNEEIEQVTSLVANHMRFKDVQQMRVSTLKRFLRLPHFDEHLELHRLDCMASNGYTEAYRFVKEQLNQLQEDELRPPRLLTGDDLIKTGYRPGPQFGPALEAVETAQLEGEIRTRAEALKLAQSVLERKE
ncbi:MAG: CCA tRNA nucleotidyltransferase [Acidobacteriaceae bacterium]|nr:CCA tRNA nucleotidyltransferase [Acidobacteriaceae bacterium]MBV9227461.1 CCA tRNA nucleotidyltransferase [Acidobacteriaceae bacterium]MBV9305262.1 CCA tRNA nucleotidyltransferase [Acidobacteriaceae bacterium]MBV9679023.1 CCA tRNA nucleotidyltransferase [Acidobacteriaceae bacterium]